MKRKIIWGVVILERQGRASPSLGVTDGADGLRKLVFAAPIALRLEDRGE